MCTLNVKEEYTVILNNVMGCNGHQNGWMIRKACIYVKVKPQQVNELANEST